MKIFILIFLTLMPACSIAQRVKNEKVFFTYPSKMGLFYIENPIEYSKTKNFPIAQNGIFVTSIKKTKVTTGKYDEALNAVEPFVNPADTIKKLFLNFYSNKKKSIKLVSARIDSGLVKFRGPRKEGKWYYDFDLRFLREGLGVDELLILSVRYGLNSSYTMGIEFYKSCIATIQYQVINLRDNSFIIRDHSESSVSISEWNTPPEYEILKTGIRKALDRVIQEETQKYN